MNSDVLALLRNYLRSTLRTISKNKVYMLLNILGLALGMAACLFILQYVSYERSYDTFHENYEDLYRVRYQIYRNNALEVDCAAAVPRVGPFMKEKMPEVVDFARAYPMSGVVAYENIQFREERMHMADPSFLEIFTFPLEEGDAQRLSEPYTVVISRSAADKYFKHDDPIGKRLKIDGNDEVEVVGVAADAPNNSHIKFDFLISFETLNVRTRNDDGISASETSWGWYDYNTYVLLHPDTDPMTFDEKFRTYLWEERGDQFRERNFHTDFPLQAVADIHLHSDLLQESEPEEQGDGQAVAFLGIIALFILLIAWINYVNLSTARSLDRSQEVGVRKTLGATRRQLVYQFLTESFVLNFFAFCISIAIVVLGIRSFNRLTDSSLNLAFLSDGVFWAYVLGVLSLGSVLAGLYPAFVLSSFRPVEVLKGKFSSAQSGNILRKALVVFQFAASVTLIASTIIVYQQLAHMKNMDLGFDMKETLVVEGPSVIGDSLYASTDRAFKDEVLKNASISRVSSSSNVPGDEIFWTNGIKREEQSRENFKIIYNVGVDYEYFDTYQIKMLAGRNYGQRHATDTASLILNNAAIRYLGFSSPDEALGKKVTFWGRPKSIVGIVDDYHQMSAKSAIAPIAFPLIEGANYYTFKINGENPRNTVRHVQELYSSFFPGNPFDYFFLDQFFNRQYANEQKFSRVFSLFAGFAIFVACLGLFGLASFSAIKRSKEIGVRKILGASVPNIVELLSREYIVLIVLANIIAWPAIYFIMTNWLENFSNRISLGWTAFLVASVAVVNCSLGCELPHHHNCSGAPSQSDSKCINRRPDLSQPSTN